MSSTRKRRFHLTTRSVSPPSVRRKGGHAADTSAVVDGHALETLPTSQVRIVSWNVNGARPFLQKKISFSSSQRGGLREILRRFRWPQLMCLQEVKIKAGDRATQQQLQTAANENRLTDEPLYQVLYSLPRDQFNATSFGGAVHGVASIVRQDYGTRMQETRRPKWDREGRLLIHEIDNGLVVINGYWVNGTSAPYRDPVTGETSGTRHDVKLRYHSCILQEVLDYQKKGQPVVLVGDMNVAREPIDGYPNLRTSPLQHCKNRKDFNEKFFSDKTGMQGVDVFRHFHGRRKKYTWHSASRPHGTSCDRVDLIITSPSLIENNAVTGTDICDNPEDRQHSDHVPLWISIDESKIAQPD